MKALMGVCCSFLPFVSLCIQLPLPSHPAQPLLKSQQITLWEFPFMQLIAFPLLLLVLPLFLYLYLDESSHMWRLSLWC